MESGLSPLAQNGIRAWQNDRLYWPIPSGNVFTGVLDDVVVARSLLVDGSVALRLYDSMAVIIILGRKTNGNAKAWQTFLVRNGYELEAREYSCTLYRHAGRESVVTVQETDGDALRRAPFHIDEVDLKTKFWDGVLFTGNKGGKHRYLYVPSCESDTVDSVELIVKREIEYWKDIVDGREVVEEQGTDVK